MHRLYILICVFIFVYAYNVCIPFITLLFTGLAVPTIGVNAFHTSKTLIDKMLIVK